MCHNWLLLMAVWVVPILLVTVNKNGYEHVCPSLQHQAFGATIRTDWEKLMYYLDNGLRGLKNKCRMFYNQISHLWK